MVTIMLEAVLRDGQMANIMLGRCNYTIQRKI